MTDLVLDTNVLAEFLSQYFGPAERGRASFKCRQNLSSEAVRRINKIRERGELEDSVTSIVISSALAFVELVRQWDEIVRDRFEPHQLAAFLEQPPDWFSVAPLDEDLIEFFCDVPTQVAMAEGVLEPIEWTDAVHAATVFSRGDSCLIVTTDQRLRNMACLHGRVL